MFAKPQPCLRYLKRETNKQKQKPFFHLGLLSMSWPTELSTSGLHPSPQQDLPRSLSLLVDHTSTGGIMPGGPLIIPESRRAGDASVQAQVPFEERQGDTEKQNQCRSDWNAPESSLQVVQGLDVRLEVLLAHAQAKSLSLGNSQKATKKRQQTDTHLMH